MSVDRVTSIGGPSGQSLVFYAFGNKCGVVGFASVHSGSLPLARGFSVALNYRLVALLRYPSGWANSRTITNIAIPINTCPAAHI